MESENALLYSLLNLLHTHTRRASIVNIAVVTNKWMLARPDHAGGLLVLIPRHQWDNNQALEFQDRVGHHEEEVFTTVP